MKKRPKFVPYDDDNIEHVMAGSDYGQTGSFQNLRWSEEDDYRDIENYYSFLLKCKTLRKKP